MYLCFLTEYWKSVSSLFVFNETLDLQKNRGMTLVLGHSLSGSAGNSLGDLLKTFTNLPQSWQLFDKESCCCGILVLILLEVFVHDAL